MLMQGCVSLMRMDQEASMCGNGLRCVARYANDVLGLDKMIVETMKANLLVEKTEDIYEGIPTFKVEISP